MQIKLREDWKTQHVRVFKDDIETYHDREYTGAARWAQLRYNLSGEELMDIYADYRADYDSYTE